MRNIFLNLAIISLCYEYYDPWGISSWLTLPKLFFIIYCFFGMCSPFFYRIFSYANIRYVVPFLLFGLYWIGVTIFYAMYEQIPLSTNQILTFFMCLLMYSCLLAEMQDQKTKNNLLHMIILSIWSVSILLLFGVGREYIGYGRETFFGCNANSLGCWAWLNFFFTLLYVDKKPKAIKYFYFIVSLICSIFLLVKSGSFGALLVSFICLIAYAFLDNKISLIEFLLRTIFIIFIINIAVYFIFSADSSYTERLDAFHIRSLTDVSIDELLANRDDYSSGRSFIWEKVLEIFYQYPLCGVGSSLYDIKMDWGGFSKSPHNLYLELLSKTGILGTILFLLPFGMIIKTASKNFKKNHLALFLLFAIFVWYAKSGGGLTEKILWFGLACVFSIIRDFNCNTEQLTAKPKEEKDENSY